MTIGNRRERHASSAESKNLPRLHLPLAGERHGQADVPACQVPGGEKLKLRPSPRGSATDLNRSPQRPGSGHERSARHSAAPPLFRFEGA